MNFKNNKIKLLLLTFILITFTIGSLNAADSNNTSKDDTNGNQNMDIISKNHIEYNNKSVVPENTSTKS